LSLERMLHTLRAVHYEEHGRRPMPKRKNRKLQLGKKVEGKKISAKVALPRPIRKLPSCSGFCAGCDQGHHCGGKRCECTY